MKSNTEVNGIFHNMVSDYLDKASKRQLRPTTYASHELELGFGKKTPITRTDYENVISELIRNGWYTDNINGTEMLRITSEFLIPSEENQSEEIEQKKEKNKMRMSQFFRLEIVGSDLIQEYCRTDSIDSISKIDSSRIKFTEKRRVKDSNGSYFDRAVFQDHGFSVNYKLENDYSVDFHKNKLVLDTYRNWSKTKKVYRCINRVRFRHDNIPIFADVTVVKMNKFLPSYTIQSSGVLNLSLIHI